MMASASSRAGFLTFNIQLPTCPRTPVSPLSRPRTPRPACFLHRLRHRGGPLAAQLDQRFITLSDINERDRELGNGRPRCHRLEICYIVARVKWILCLPVVFFLLVACRSEEDQTVGENDLLIPLVAKDAGTLPTATSTATTGPTEPPTMTHVQSITISTGSIWSIPVHDGSHLIVSTEVIGPSGGIYLSKYDLSLDPVGTATPAVGPDDVNNNAALLYTYANNITSIADHKHIFQGGHHYLTFSTSGNGSGGNLYLMKIDTNLVLQGIVEVTTDNAPTNDMFLVGDGSRVHVGKFQPGQGHDVYVFDADLNSIGAAIPIGNTGNGNSINQHANGAVAIFHDDQFHLVAPETLAPGEGDYFYQIIFDADWNVVRGRIEILTDMTMLGIVSGLSHEPNTDTFIVHYTRGDTDGGGPIYQAVYDSDWALLENAVLVATDNYQRPHSVFVDDDLFLGYDSAGVYLSKFNVSYP